MSPDFPPLVTAVLAQVKRELRQTNAFDSGDSRDVTSACCAAYVFGTAYLHSGVDRAYLIACTVMLRKRYAIPMTICVRRDDPDSVEALADRWLQAYERGAWEHRLHVLENAKLRALL